MLRIAITENTKDLLKLREDDYRIALISDILFSPDISGSHPNREFTVINNKNEEESHVLRVAGEYDFLQYEKVGSSNDMKMCIEENLAALQRLKQSNASIPGTLAVGDIWVFLFTTDKDGEDLHLNTYFNPNSTDCSEIFKSERNIVLVGFAVTHPVGKVPEGIPSELIEFTFISPLDSANLNEYRRIALEEEAKVLQNMFLIKFDTSKL